MSTAAGWIRRLLLLVQAALGVRVAWRLLRTGGDGPVVRTPTGSVPEGAVAVIVPVLDEMMRLRPCLEGLLAQGAEVGDILVVDGGSGDGTPDLVREIAELDGRLRLVEAGPAPAGWNGKVWGLHAGERAVGSGSTWLLTVDADVRLAPGLARSLVVHAERRGLRLLSVATSQRLAGWIDGLLHPALLATFVYRFGRPGGATEDPSAVVANGQCFLLRRDLLAEIGGFAAARDSLCEDVTLARLAARAGDRVGFYESDGLVDVAMFDDWRQTWRSWPRSLTTRDALFGPAGWLGLVEVALLQALPPLLLLVGWRSGPGRRLNQLLLGLRLGLLVGVARAYPSRPPTYWLSPLLDLPAAFALWRSALRRHHDWRGRTYAAEKGRLLVA